MLARRDWSTLVLAILATIAVCLMALPASLLFSHVPRLYNEGWNAFIAQRAMLGDALYPPTGSTVFNNYLPLSFYVVGGLGQFLDDDILAGRIVSWLSLAWVTACLFTILRSQAVGRRFALFGALVFLVLIASEGMQFIGTDDPQMLGHAFQIQGLALVLGARLPLGTGRIVAALLLVLAGVLVKHNLLAAPLAVTVGLALRDRRGFVIWVVAGVLASVIALAVLAAAFGSSLFRSVLLHPRVVSWERSFGVLKGWVAPLVPSAAIALGAAYKNWKTLGGVVLGVYTLIGGVLALVFGAGEGVAINCAFDLMIASGIGAGLFAPDLVLWLRRRNRAQAVAIAMALIALPMLVHARAVAAGLPQLLAISGREARWEAEIDAIAVQPGPVACEILALCYWAGKDQEIDFFNTGQAVQAGALDAGVVLRMIEQGSFVAIQLGDPNHTYGALESRRMPATINAAIARRYQPLNDFPLTLFVRKPPPP